MCILYRRFGVVKINTFRNGRPFQDSVAHHRQAGFRSALPASAGQAECPRKDPFRVKARDCDWFCGPFPLELPAVRAILPNLIFRASRNSRIILNW